jgi:methyl-accepting chemotaxis protein
MVKWELELHISSIGKNEMRPAYNRITGIILVGSAIVGVILSLAGLVWVWSTKGPLTNDLISKLDIAASSLDTTAKSLAIADQSLKTSSSSTVALETALKTLSESINETQPLVDSLSSLLGKDLPAAIKTTQTSLESAQSSAQIIDSVLRSVTSIPLYPGARYNPPVPLHIALAQVSASLDPLPADFSTMQNSLIETNNNLGLIKAETDLITRNIRDIHASLDDAQNVISEYQTIVEQMQTGIQHTREILPGRITTWAWILSIVFLWVAISQIGLFMYGLEKIGNPLTKKQ